MTLKLDLLVVPTYSTMTMGVLDSSIYPSEETEVANPTLFVSVPGFDEVELPFSVRELNLLNSTDLGITEEGDEQKIPDGVYYLRYAIEPIETSFVEKAIVRVDNLQEKFDETFLKFEFMECDRAVKEQVMVELNTIYLLIQGAVAAANGCATAQGLKLYNQAERMLNNLLNNDCGCSHNNFIPH